ncbi:hypothetical protein BH11BAC7_BH11BAC7_07270 [soil metagenome]
MKDLLLFLVLFCLLTGTSCNMEKRLYRNGWYVEKNKKSSFTNTPETTSGSFIANEIKQQTKSSLPDTVLQVERNTSNPPLVKLEQKIKKLRKVQTQMRGPVPRMTYSQARAAMAKQGCTPNKAAKTVYIMSIISAAGMFFVFGIFLVFVTLILAVFAADRVVEDGSCVNENLAIVEAARRICLGALIGMLILVFVFLALMLAIVFAAL